MRSRWRIAGFVVAFLVLLAPAAGAIAPRLDAADGSVSFPTPVRIQSPARQLALDGSARWRGFEARYGKWQAVWNEATETPHRAFGHGIPLPGFAGDAASADRAVRGFIADNPELFGGAPELETVAVRLEGAVWYLSYRQTVRGVPVLFADWEFRVGLNGRLFAFGADAQRPGPAVRTSATIVGAVAREAAKAGLAFDPGTDRTEGGTDLYLIPYPTETGTDYRLAYDVRLHTANPRGNWIAYVDAATGEVLWRQNRVRYAIAGNVSGTIHPVLPTDPVSSRSFAHHYVTVGSTTVPTDNSGNYSVPAGGTVFVSAQIRGQFCDVNRADSPDASFSTSAPNPSTVNIAWGVSVAADFSERDAYYHVNVAHDYIKGLDPGFTGLDYAMPAAVNINDVCNAYWDGFGVNFFAAGGGCVNTGTMPDVIYHEYGHGVNDFVYLVHGAANGMTNGALHEGMADANAAFITDDPVIGDGFTGPGSSLRTIDNTNRWPEDGSGDPHVTGLIIGGAFWDLRQAVGLGVTQLLAHRAMFGIPDDPDDGIAMHEFFVETLVADDDDADLSNGTPHSSEIIAAFNAHGIGTSFFLHITHTAIADQPAGDDFPVRARFQYTGAIGQLDASSPTLHYSINRGGYIAAAMTPTGSPDEFVASMPAPSGSIVHYYFTANDSYGAAAVDPPAAPDRSTYAFVVGPAATVLAKDMELDPGWVIGAVGDNAVTGIWIRANPVGTSVGDPPIFVQPEDDHTPGAGTVCFVTGNGVAGDPNIGANDVDGGRTTLTSAAFDATAGGIVHPILEYYRWYSNNAGSNPGTDLWRVDVSNDGGASWASVESTPVTNNSWLRIVFRIEDYVTPTNNMKLRFIAADEGGGSVVEAAVDDFRLLGFPSTLAAPDPEPRAGALVLAAPSPNPSRAGATLRYALPVAGAARLGIYDLGGRLVRSLVEGALEAGPHSVEWDGRDATGRPVATGSYFVRLRHGGREAVRMLVRLR